MTEMTPNDRAYIKITQDLERYRNDFMALTKLASIGSSLNLWQKDQFKEIRPSRLHSPGLEGFSKVLHMIGNSEYQTDLLAKTKAKILELEILVEAYMSGRDIVAEKLSR